MKRDTARFWAVIVITAIVFYLLFVLFGPKKAHAYTGSTGVWATKAATFTSKNFSGDSTGVKNAISYVAAGGRIRVYPGAMTISSRIVIPAGVEMHWDQGTWTFTGASGFTVSNKATLAGQGYGSTEFTLGPTFSNSSFISNQDTTGAQASVRLFGFSLNGNKSAGARCDAGIKLKKIFVNTVVRDCMVFDVTGIGFRIEGDNAGSGGQFVLDNCASNNTGHYGFYLNSGLRCIWMSYITAERPGRNSAGIFIDGTTTTSAGNLGCALDHLYTEIQDSMSVGVRVDGAASVKIDNYTASIPSGRMRAAIQIKNTNNGNFYFSPSGLTVNGLYAESDTLIEDQQAGIVVTTGADPNNPYRHLSDWRSPIFKGTVSTNGYRNSNQIVGLQPAHFGPDIASAATMAPHPEGGNIFFVTGTTTSTDVTFLAAFVGRDVTFQSSTAWAITSGNHWKLASNYAPNATGNDDVIFGYIDANRNFIERGRSIK